MSNPEVVLLRTNAGQPVFGVAYNEETQQPWISIYSYLTTDVVKNVFGGAFVQVISPNAAGTMVSAVGHNPGMLDATPGREQGIHDVSFLVDGQSVIVSFSGRYKGEGEAGVMPSRNDLLALGCVFNQWKSLYLTVYPPRPGMPREAYGSVKVSDGYVALYR